MGKNIYGEIQRIEQRIEKKQIAEWHKVSFCVNEFFIIYESFLNRHNGFVKMPKARKG